MSCSRAKLIIICKNIINFPTIIEIRQIISTQRAGVRRWWKEKAREIYELIPDFGGFLVKANYSGMPISAQYEQPAHSLKYYRSIPFPYDWKGWYE